MKCPNCNHSDFPTTNSMEDWQQCPNCGWEVCRLCNGSGAVDTPFSGDDPSCENCYGEGGFEAWEPGEQIWDPAGGSYTTERRPK